MERPILRKCQVCIICRSYFLLFGKKRQNIQLSPFKSYSSSNETRIRKHAKRGGVLYWLVGTVFNRLWRSAHCVPAEKVGKPWSVECLAPPILSGKHVRLSCSRELKFNFCFAIISATQGWITAINLLPWYYHAVAVEPLGSTARN